MCRFGGGQQQQQGEKRGEDVTMELPVTLEDLYNGRVYEMQVKKQEVCSHCSGTGARSENDIHTCNVPHTHYHSSLVARHHDLLTFVSTVIAYVVPCLMCVLCCVMLGHHCQGRGMRVHMHQIAPGFVQQVQQQCEYCGGKVTTHRHIHATHALACSYCNSNAILHHSCMSHVPFCCIVDR